MIVVAILAVLVGIATPTISRFLPNQRLEAAGREVFGIMQSWLRDLIVNRIAPEKIIHRDLIDKIENYGPRHRVVSLMSKINAITTAQQDIHANANIRLTLDALMLSLAMEE